MFYLVLVVLCSLVGIPFLIRRRFRRFFTAILCTGLILTLTGLFFQHKEKAPSKDFGANFLLDYHLVRGEKIQAYLQQLSAKKHSVNEPICKLPVLDPFHKSVKSLIVPSPPLDCGKLHSSFENNTLQVKADGVVAVAYRIISRPKGDDFSSIVSEPLVVMNSKQDARKNVYEVEPGISGCIMHKSSKKCLHPFGGQANPNDGEKVVFHSDCCLGRIQFTMTPDKAIKHNSSGLCLHVNHETNHVSLAQNCSTKFNVLYGTLRVENSHLCLQSKSHPDIPENDGLLEVGKNCTEKFAFRSLREESFEGNATVNADFVRVDITRSEGKDSITEVHMQTAPKQEVLQRKVQPAGIPVNVAMIMFDSTSAANFVRQMPITRSYLKTRPTVFLEGETIVGDGTTAQLCAMLTGIPEEEQPEARRSMFKARPVDRWRWIFNDYKKRGYVTMYSEDSPGLGTFNLRLKGFRNPPTDHYGRPFWLEADKHARKDYCSTNQPIHKVTMKYSLSLFRSYPNNPKFAFLLFSDLSHGNMNALKYADQDLTDLLKTMDKESYLDESIVFIFGDHGVRYGSMRKTLQGKLEERLPHMSITFPSWFPKKYPQLYENVQRNAKLLTTPFDIYATLRHVISYPVPPRDLRFGQSLFIPMDPQNRTCASAGVEEHWCPCLNLERVPVDSSIVKQVVNYVVNFINSLLEERKKPKRVCHRLSLKEIKTAQMELPNKKVQRFKNSLANRKCDSCGVVLGQKDENNLIKDTLYQIQFLTSPNDGFYEASVQLKGGVPSIKGAISRVDTYGDQPRCIQDTHVHLMKFCYCR
ncbi:uncharacterized protein LOC116299306 [Actinia tenebrosa]|uniref:Uncharacterized protein LOC116299306 n=1 Tax=Actinia tenebrosa TaxID=6105 RepID=A0A6P8I734_ACTTE|nr:uncharacterized protein LOC116299306 [Actinia tenebrosa]